MKKVNKQNNKVMRTLFSVLTLAFFLLGNAVMAQDFVFRVLANKGNNTYKSSESSDWEPLRTGATLRSGYQIKTSDGSFIGLYHASGRTVEVKEAGEYGVDDLASSVASTKSSVTSKYADFVMSKMGESKEEALDNYKKSMATTGAVDRALASNAAIKLMAHQSSDVINSELVLRWNEVETDNDEEVLTYQVSFMNLFDEVVKKAETEKTYIKVDFAANEFKEVDSYVKIKLSVKGYDLSSDEYVITMKSQDEAKDLMAELGGLKETVDSESALSQLVLAAFYEDNDLLLDALTCYENAIRMEPEVEDFKDAYELFLIRNGFGN